MELYTVVLFAHIFVVLCAFALAGVLHATQWLMPSAATVSELRVLARPQKWGVGFIPIIGLLLLLGAWLVQLSEDEAITYEFSDGWVWTAVVALGLLFVGGAALEGPSANKLNEAVDAAPEGPVPPELRAHVASPFPWVSSHAQTFLAASVVFNMANKPEAAGAVTVLVVGTAIGALIGLLGARRAAARSTVAT
jgi:hypothetical protein